MDCCCCSSACGGDDGGGGAKSHLLVTGSSLSKSNSKDSTNFSKVSDFIQHFIPSKSPSVMQFSPTTLEPAAGGWGGTSLALFPLRPLPLLLLLLLVDDLFFPLRPIADIIYIIVSE